MNIKGPCLCCEDRQILCHSTCEKYIEYRKMVDKRNLAERHQKKINNDCFPDDLKKRQGMR